MPQKRILESVKHFGIYTFTRGPYSSDAMVLERSKLKRTIEFSRNCSNNRNTSHRDYSRESSWFVCICMLETAAELVPKRGEQRVELVLVLACDCQKVGGSRRSKDEAKGFGVVNIFFVFTSVFKFYLNPVLADYVSY